MFAWGSTVNGELGLGGIEEENIITPTRLKYCIVETIEDGMFLHSYLMIIFTDY